jgi:hypothetical protein
MLEGRRHFFRGSSTDTQEESSESGSFRILNHDHEKVPHSIFLKPCPLVSSRSVLVLHASRPHLVVVLECNPSNRGSHIYLR